MVPATVSTALHIHIGAIKQVKAVGGGCIAKASRIETEKGLFFLKWGPGPVARTFAAEAAGLKALYESEHALKIPRVLAYQASDPGYLLMEWIDSGPKRVDFWEGFGQGLADLHRHTAERYGFAMDNYIGRSPQQNAWRDAWPAFFRECRLEPQVAMARRSGAWQNSWDVILEALYNKLDAILPVGPPASLLHGDLWSGNYMATASGPAALIDPAVYFGHREADLAMTELFGGFNESFYKAYDEAWPLDAGYEERKELYDLYHLINHLNLFGGGYANGVGRILEKFA